MSLLTRYGVATGFYPMNYASVSEAAVLTMLDQCKAVGADFVRVDILQTTQYENRFDFVLTAAEARGMRTVACLRGSSGPTTPSAAASFATAMATRFGSRVYIYEYDNEPNLPGTNHYYSNPAQYGAELSAVYDAIKAVNASYLVSTCGLGWNGAGTISGWWPGALTGGASGKFDVFNIHTYGHPATDPGWAEAFAANNQSKPHLITEAGAGVGTHVSTRAQQAQVVTEAMLDGRAEGIAIYTMSPGEASSYAMVDSSGNPYPSYTAFQNVAISGGGTGGGTSGPGAYVQSKSTWPTTSATSTALTFTSGVGANSLLACFVGWNNASVTCTVADSRNGAWTALGGPQTGTGALSAYRGQLFYVPNAASGTTTVTATFSSAVTRRGIAMAEYSGMATTSAVDVTGSYKTQTSSTPSSNSVVATQQDMLVSGIITAETINSVGSGFTLREGGFGVFGGNGFADQSVAAGTFSSSWVTDNASTHENIIAIAALKAGSTPTTASVPFRSMMGYGS